MKGLGSFSEDSQVSLFILSQVVALRCDWWEAKKTLKVALRCFTRDVGVLSVTTSGMTEMLRWCVDSLASGAFAASPTHLDNICEMTS